MEYIKLTPDNLEKEHICCAISNNKDIQVASKKAWLAERLKEGLVFLKSVERGKCFIEYIPAENAWCPIIADGYMHINCFWVSGSFKGHGYANDLLNACISDAKAKGRRGVTVISSPKKMPFLSDPKYLAYKGFKVADKAEPFFTLMYLPFDESAPAPKFKEGAKKPQTDKRGFAVYYTHGCPFTAKYVPLVESFARERGIEFESVLIDNKEKAQNAPCVWTNYAVFYNGEYISNEILNEKRFSELVEKLTR
ncbi:MAG TPA: GNAT family N-acetyltransferase [Clostridiales bacterium]|nr:GNAT family N-acetyltransferase [Clostridiales bacterium]